MEHERDYEQDVVSKSLFERAEAAEAERDELVLQNEACGNSIVDLEAENRRLREALEQIEHYTFDVVSDDGADVQAMKEIARAALAGSGDE